MIYPEEVPNQFSVFSCTQTQPICWVLMMRNCNEITLKGVTKHLFPYVVCWGIFNETVLGSFHSSNTDSYLGNIYYRPSIPGSKGNAANEQRIKGLWVHAAHDCIDLLQFNTLTHMCHQLRPSLVQTMDYFVNGPSQWETLHCNIVSHSLGIYTKWSLKP